MQATGQAIRFVVLGVPVAQPRQRHRIVKPAIGKAFVQNYTPKRDPVQQFKVDIKAVAEQTGLPLELWIGPIGVRIDFYLPRPKSLMRRKDPDGPVWCYIGKDWDNLAKATTDALAGVLWHDDRQICEAIVRKLYHEKTGRPRVEIEAWEVPS